VDLIYEYLDFFGVFPAARSEVDLASERSIVLSAIPTPPTCEPRKDETSISNCTFNLIDECIPFRVYMLHNIPAREKFGTPSTASSS